MYAAASPSGRKERHARAVPRPRQRQTSGQFGRPTPLAIPHTPGWQPQSAAARRQRCARAQAPTRGATRLARKIAIGISGGEEVASLVLEEGEVVIDVGEQRQRGVAEKERARHGRRSSRCSTKSLPSIPSGLMAAGLRARSFFAIHVADPPGKPANDRNCHPQAEQIVRARVQPHAHPPKHADKALERPLDRPAPVRRPTVLPR